MIQCSYKLGYVTAVTSPYRSGFLMFNFQEEQKIVNGIPASCQGEDVWSFTADSSAQTTEEEPYA